jgi:acetyl-CoA acetyltransferase
MPTAVILEAVRTPFVRAGEDLRDVPAKELARRVLREVLDRAGLEPEDVDEVVLGNAATPADSPNLARVATLLAGYPEAVPAVTVHRKRPRASRPSSSRARKCARAANVVACGGAEA